MVNGTTANGPNNAYLDSKSVVITLRDAFNSFPALLHIAMLVFFGYIIATSFLYYKEEIKTRKMTKEVETSKLKMALKNFVLVVCLLQALGFFANPMQQMAQNPYSDIMGIYLSRQTLYLTLAVGLINIIPTFRPCLTDIHSILFSIAFTFKTLTTLVFWTFYFIKPELVIHYSLLKPETSAPFADLLCLHLFPMIFLIFELSDFKLYKFKGKFKFIGTYGGIWWATAVFLCKLRGEWLYGFLSYLPTGPYGIYGYIFVVPFILLIYALYKGLACIIDGSYEKTRVYISLKRFLNAVLPFTARKVSPYKFDYTSYEQAYTMQMRRQS